MAWLVERLLADYEHIKQKGDFDSDMFSLLLTLEMKIEEIRKKGFLSNEEVELIKLLRGKRTITELSKKLGLSRISTSMKIDKLTSKLAVYLGDIYTDDGYIEYMANGYGLNEEQKEKLREVIQGKYRRTYIR